MFIEKKDSFDSYMSLKSVVCSILPLDRSYPSAFDLFEGDGISYLYKSDEFNTIGAAKIVFDSDRAILKDAFIHMDEERGDFENFDRAMNLFYDELRCVLSRLNTKANRIYIHMNSDDVLDMKTFGNWDVKYGMRNEVYLDLKSLVLH